MMKKEEKTSNIPDSFMKNRHREMTYRRQFEEIFRVPFRRFFNIMSGFDIVAFDDYLETPNGISTKQHIEAVYGAEAVALIENLIRR